jgi:hypothetical protein
MKKCVSLISGVIFLALTISAAFIVYETAVPVIKKMQSAAVIEQMKNTFVELNKIIKKVASEGEGSRRSVDIKIDFGKLVVNETEDVIYWEYETDAPVMSPRTMQTYGDIIIGSNLDTKAYEANYTLVNPEIPAYVMENEHLKVYIRKIGSTTNYENYNTSQLLLAIYQKDLDRWLNNEGFLEISIDNEETSKTGNGYTTLEKTGNFLPFATVTAYMNSSYKKYYINFTLESGTDFLEIRGGL